MGDSQPTIEIEYSKVKIMLVFAICLLLIIIGMWRLKTGHTDNSHSALETKLITLAAMAPFVFGCYFCMIILTVNRPGMIINDKGILINHIVRQADFIPWDNMLGVEVMMAAETKMVSIKLKMPNDYMKTKSVWVQVMMRMSIIASAPTVGISTAFLQTDPDTLLKLLSERLESFKATHMPDKRG